ncbi:MAG: hypothetical protein KDD11_09835 [Acidobacteria bacterium]|nr:hypothetical protein [Acidobacteriota bacterium]
MRIQEKHIYHGAALAQIVEHPSFKALNKADKRYGHYLVNQNRRLLVKYRTSGDSPWQFSFPQSELALMAADLRAGARLFLCLVCGDITVAVLGEEDVRAVLDLGGDSQQWVTVELPPNSSMRVRGSLGTLSKTVPHSAFPRLIFESEDVLSVNLGGRG